MSYKLIVELGTIYDTREAALNAFHNHFTGPGIHSIRIVDDNGNTVEGPKQWGTFADKHGTRLVRSLNRNED